MEKTVGPCFHAQYGSKAIHVFLLVNFKFDLLLLDVTQQRQTTYSPILKVTDQIRKSRKGQKPPLYKPSTSVHLTLAVKTDPVIQIYFQPPNH